MCAINVFIEVRERKRSFVKAAEKKQNICRKAKAAVRI